MRVSPILLAIGTSFGLSLPALALPTPDLLANHHDDSCKTDCKSTCGDSCEDGKACPHKQGEACMHAQAGKSTGDKKGDCCKEGAACCDEGGDCCDDAHRKGGHDHHGMGHGHHGMGHDHGHWHGGGMSVGLRNFWNQGNGASYLSVNMEKLWGGRQEGRTWFNPAAGMGWMFGIDPGNQTINRHFLMGGPLVQNTMAFGPINVTLGLQAGLGCVFDTTQTLDFQNANHFYALDPRLTLGWQITPRAALNVTGSYLFTTRPAAASGPTAGLNMHYRF